MAEEQKHHSWWGTVPGVLTAAAGVITAVSGLILALHQTGVLDGKESPANNEQPSSQVAQERPKTPSPPSQDSPSGIKYFFGAWENIDPATRGITKLDIRVSDTSVFIHPWGKCHPTDCDWGEVKAEAFTDGVSTDVKADTRLLQAIIKKSFKETTLVIRPTTGGRLKIESATRFIDQSGRSSYSSTSVLQRAR